MFTTDALTREPTPEQVHALNSELMDGELGAPEQHRGMLMAAAVFFVVVLAAGWAADWTLPFWMLGRTVGLFIALMLTPVIIVLVALCWKAIPDTLMNRDVRRDWQSVALFARENGMEYRAECTEVPPTRLIGPNNISPADVVRASSGPFQETGEHTWTFHSVRGEQGDAQSYYVRFRLPASVPYAFVRRTETQRDYAIPLWRATGQLPAATLPGALGQRYTAVAEPGFDPAVWQVLTADLLTCVESLGGDFDVEICGQGFWLHTDGVLDMRDPRFWRAIDVVIANVLTRIPGAGLSVAPIPIPAAPAPAGHEVASFTPRSHRPLRNGVSCVGSIVVGLLLQAAGFALHVGLHWPVR